MNKHLIVLSCVLNFSAFAHVEKKPELRFVEIAAKTREDRSRIADFGVSIEFVRSDSVWGFADPIALKQLKASGQKILGDFTYETGRGGHDNILNAAPGFPEADARFHDYPEMVTSLKSFEASYPDLAKVHVIGKSLEGRDLLAIQINTSRLDREQGSSTKPGVIYMGNHHAREHLSAELPIMYAEYLLKNSENPELRNLLENRDIWILPMVNPDGVEFDISTGRYQMWRKNRRPNDDGSYGVDLNRNYGYLWGTGGSSDRPSNETYMGKAPFSEPETQVVKNFVESHLNAKILLTLHTFSELVLYPWGHTYDSIQEKKDLAVFETMAKTMAGWNRYTPQQSSDLYITSGDTTDWAYGTHGIFAFTFELSPASIFSGGFYPGARAIDPTFNANLKPFLYLLEMADDPYRATETSGQLMGEFGYLGPVSKKSRFDVGSLTF